ncbi:DUF6308 family protein [Geodermatophilus sp. URMC 60]
MPYRLPKALRDPNNTHTAVSYLRTYYSLCGSQRYTGSYFDDWETTDPYRFTADDLVAVSFLSVYVPSMAARELLLDPANRFESLLRDIGPDHDLAEVDSAINEQWSAWRLYSALRRLPGVGPTIASKLCARKRPRLVPIYDSVVARVTDCYKRQWEPLRLELREHGLQDRLIGLRQEVEVSASVSLLRVYDVVAWMEGKDEAGPVTQEEERGSRTADPPHEDFSALDDEDGRNPSGTSGNDAN